MLALPAMLDCRFDHLIIVAPSLAAGATVVERWLGVPLQPGGEHPRMGTHNRLLRLGDGTFLEVIAPNPAAPRPERPRWFGLDDLPADAPPRLATWAACGLGLAGVADALRPVHGELLPMSRGDLHWQITVPPDGHLPMAGLAPTLLEWASDDHPARRLPDQGCRLHRLTAHTPEPAALQAWLARLGLGEAVAIAALPAGAAPWLDAAIDTPAGLRRLPATGD